VGIFGRLRRAIARVFRPSPPPPPPTEPPPAPPGGDDLDIGVRGPAPVDDWFIAATWDGPGTKARYTGPHDLMRLSPGGQVTVAYRDPDTGLVTYRVIHGPFRGDEDDIWEQIEFTTRIVSPP
jgi:hypothetical protein